MTVKEREEGSAMSKSFGATIISHDGKTEV
jgi:hypothetical protein